MYDLLKTKFSHLDIAGRPVVVLEKNNVVPEHNQYFQVLLLCISAPMHLDLRPNQIYAITNLSVKDIFFYHTTVYILCMWMLWDYYVVVFFFPF